MSKDIRDILDVTKIVGGYGNTSAAVFNMLHGINHRGAGNIVPANMDGQGLTFFTKPNLNLSYDSVLSTRRLSFLANTDPMSMASAIRCMLSPRVDSPWGGHTMPNDGKLPRSAVIDDRNAFIPMLSNSLLSLSGWPDFVLEAFTSPEGLRKETVSWADSIGDNYSAFDLSANFQNMDGDPIIALFAIWTEYAARVAEGTMNPYPRCIIENEVDYQTRIYRLILDPSKRYVRKIADIGVGFPSAVPIGAAFNYSSDALFGSDNDQISIRFSCTGVRYNDPITVYNFNKVVELFNSSMHDNSRGDLMVQITNEKLLRFNYNAYPRIEKDNALNWYVTKEKYSQMNALLDGNLPKINPADMPDHLGIPSTSATRGAPTVS